ncbi:hypothetical protein LOY70_29290 [Pseudomonas sp. B21-054]|uniref:hypothetical protein n=1 Tax=Pseudomonas sp. B21-054 TaxID=2895494 RepID=UPI002231E51C|nr:hypothetical protein [Pseudomonas sp. B21-054]UZE17894.1 hypothetical protein LOY70_29290 [Pseudomonas sp. B21-054]
MSDNPIADILKREGPMLSSDLSKLLEQRYGLNPTAARKRVERCGDGINKLSQIVFPHRARFVYLEQSYGSPYFFHNLMEALKRTRSAYYLALRALELRDNIMPRAHFLIACGAPIAQKRHISAESLLERLSKAGLVKEVDLPAGQISIMRCDREQLSDIPTMWGKMKGRLIAEKVTLLAVKDWARNLGMVSYESVETREDEDRESLPKVGTFNWDLAGPSYLYPMRTYDSTTLKPGFFVCDIALNGWISPDDVGAFLHKCVTLRSLPKVGKCLQVFVAEAYQTEAFALLKGEGVIPATTESLFGHDVALALKNLCNVLNDTAKLTESPAALDKVFNDLSRIEGASYSLRGSLFEFAVAQIARSTFAGYDQQMNRIVKDVMGKQAEIDVLAVRKNHEVIFIECKGIHPASTLDDEEVIKWLDKRIPVLRGAAKIHSDWATLSQRYELWTSGGFSEEAIALVSARQEESSKLVIQLRDAEYVLAEAKASKEVGLLKTYEQHFVKHPMQEFEAEKRRKQRRKDRDAKRRLAIPATPPPLPALPTKAESAIDAPVCPEC